jgi:hypothetical protein
MASRSCETNRSGWWVDKNSDFDIIPGFVNNTHLLYFNNAFICHIERSVRSDEMVPKMVDALNLNKVRIELD